MKVRLKVPVALVAVTIAVMAVTAAFAAPPGIKTSVKPYAKSVHPSWEVEPILSAGDRVPEEDGPDGAEYQMVGIPDGLGAFATKKAAREDADGESAPIHVLVNHELNQNVTSEPRVGRPLQRGAFVSEYTLDENRDVHTGRRAFHSVYQQNTYVGPAAQANNDTRAFSRFCSGFLADRGVGFDRPIFLTGEETRRSSGATEAETFDPHGSQTVAIFDDRAHALPRMGFFAKENTVVARGTGALTVAFVLEDGPAGPDSQLYMYVGRKNPDSTKPLRRNGLDNGKLYVFVAKDPTVQDESDFQTGTVSGRWELIPDAHKLDEVELEAKADELGALGFVRIEDGAFDKAGDRFHFVTTGDGAGNRLGRGYRLSFNRGKPLNSTQLKVIYNADLVDAAGGDHAFSPDNVDLSKRWWAIDEDGTASSRPEMGERGRDGSIWLLELGGNYQPHRVAELVGMTEGGRDGVTTGPGIWETSGIIDTERFFGEESFLFDVQAHPPTGEPVANTVEDGQLLYLRRVTDPNP